MNKIEVKEKVTGTVTKKPREKKVTYVFLSDDDFTIQLEIGKDQEVEVFHYGKDCSGQIKVLLKGEKASIIYHYNTINMQKNHVIAAVEHLAKNTNSHLYFHGFNQEQNLLRFQIDVTIPKGMTEAVAYQENRIYNRTQGTSQILPNLYIDEYDVVANHESYIGPFEESILFYMQSRGLSRPKIEQLLLEGLFIQKGLTEEEKVSFFQGRKEG